MGYLLKEALKTLCGINQWAYAVFWKIGLQNPKLLIWEEYYYGPESFPDSSSQDSQAGNKLLLLVKKMMMDHHVKIVGEGLVGRAAFTERHQWIQSENLYGEAYPPEVLKEVYEQFSAGIQTVAVIPVLPHGVLQFGSYFKITETMGFLNDVVSLVHQLSHVPDVFHSECYSEYSTCLNTGDMSREIETTKTFPVINDCFDYVKNSVQNPFFEGQTSDIKPYCLSDNMITPSQLTINGSLKHEVSIPLNPEAWINQLSSPFDLKPVSDVHFQLGDDIFDILGSGCNNFASHESEVVYSTTVGNLDSGILSSICSDHLLDAVVSKSHPCPKEDSFSCKTTSTNLSTSSSTVKGSLPYGRFHHHTNGDFSGIRKYLSNTRAISSSSLCTASSNDAGTVCSSSALKGKDVKPPVPNKTTDCKRLKPGENLRPRPKDRQMIQDRVRELREIVPNGTKCSIDSLLQRTIKHMVFLQSVAKHADKMKQTVESKLISEDGGFLNKGKFQGGATWAYEIGSSSIFCPIIVEDLNQPRQMLIEMLYEERGSFLEIADIIRGLGLTILKGTMQTRKDKIWSRFIVEANKDIKRMEVFMSLVRVLEKSTEKEGVNEHTTMFPRFHRAAASAITAAGDFRNLP